MFLRNAKEEELNEVFLLYKSVKGSDFCVWNEFYPGMEELYHDFETKNLYLLFNDELIIGAISIVPENELSDILFWKINDGTEREIARVAIAPNFQGNGFALFMVQEIIEILKKQGCKSVHLSVAKSNIPALKTYLKLKFEIVGEKDMYCNHYILLEKII